MAKRHTIRAGSWESLFGRLEELVLANSGEDEFEEIFKLLIAKLYSELAQAGASTFRTHGSPDRTARAIDDLIEMAAQRWPGIVAGQPRSRLAPEHLATCVRAIEGRCLLASGLEVLDGAFEYLVSRSAKGAKGQYFTPRHVIDRCVEMMAPGPSELVVDPACGSGGFLIHTLLRRVALEPGVERPACAETGLWGFDIDQRAIQVAKALMLVAGDGQANLLRLNSLLLPGSPEDPASRAAEDPASRAGEMERTPAVEEMLAAGIDGFSGCDVVMTNPPFAGEITEQGVLMGYDLHRQGRRIERDVLFLERCVRLLRPGGRLAMVLPHNKLSSARWSYARRWLLSQMRVVAVLGLARDTFLPHTHQKAGVIFAVKRAHPREPSPDERILFLINEASGKDSRGAIVDRQGAKPSDPAWVRASHDLDELVAAFKRFTVEAQIPWEAARG